MTIALPPNPIGVVDLFVLQPTFQFMITSLPIPCFDCYFIYLFVKT